MSVSTSIPNEGVLNCWNDEHDLPDLLLSISRSARTGRLLFSNPEADKTLYVKDGKIIFAESSSEDDGLGQYLLRTGKISLVDYVRVSKCVEPGKRLGALLVAEGVLEARELVPSVMGQVREILLGLFRRTETWYRFREEPLPARESITLDLPVSQLILDGVQYVESWRRISKGVGSLDCVYRRVPDAASEWSGLELGGGAAELLDMLEEPISVDDICTRASMPDFEACRSLWAFRCLGWVEKTERVANDVTVDAPAEAPAVAADTAPRVEPAAAAAAPPTPPPSTTTTTTTKPTPTPSIPQELVETRVAIATPAEAARPEPPPKPNPIPKPEPKPNVDTLARTQLAIDPSSAASPSENARTAPDVDPPRKPIPAELFHTQLFDAEPEGPGEPEPEPPSTGEMMEAILDGEKPKPPSPPPSAKAPQAAPPSPAAAATTQFFDGASAIEPPATTEESYASAPDPPPFGFEALAFDEELPEPPRTKAAAPAPLSPPAEDPAMASFGELAYGAEEPEVAAEPEAVPVLEASVVDAQPALPVEEPPAPAPAATTLEALANSEEFARESSGFSFDSFAFEADDPVADTRAPEKKDTRQPPSQAEEMDFDMDGLGHLFSSES